MIWNLMAAVAAAICAAGSVFLVFNTLRRRAPKWLYPLSAGAAMLAYAAWSEYSWGARTEAALPASVVVVERYADQAWYQPWTYLVPRVNRFMAFDRNEVLRNPKHPDLVIVPMLLVSRFESTLSSRQLVDCAGRRRADLVGDGAFDPDGKPIGVTWSVAGEGAAFIDAVCR